MRSRVPAFPPRRRVIAFVLAASMLWAGCGGAPTLAEWEQGWRETYGALPGRADLEAGDPGPVCDEAIGMVRTAAAEYADAPNQDLREAFLDWSEYTESVFFECPPQDGFAAGYEEIDRLASEIDALIEFERSLVGG